MDLSQSLAVVVNARRRLKMLESVSPACITMRGNDILCHTALWHKSVEVVKGLLALEGVGGGGCRKRMLCIGIFENKHIGII